VETATDQELVTRFQQTGEVRHMDELVRRHIAKVRAIVFPMVLNDTDADDVTQEAFLNAVRNIGSFRGQSEFSTWLHRVALNAAYSFLRRRKRRREEKQDDFGERVDPSAGPDRRVMGLELGVQIEKALGALPASLRAAITLTAIHGMSVKEAARTEGCLTATMYWRVFEARRILGGKLGGATAS
jgi:RNA polymerase sigma-70 factor (ECF subfamily)